MNGYRCFACAGTQPADYAGFICPVCGGNLDITYDYAAATKEIDESFRDGTGDIFRYAPLLPVKELTTPFPLRVGGTPLYAAPRLGGSLGLSNLYLKDDTLNPSGSIKDRASAVTLRRAIDIGATVVSAASTGNAGSSLACLAAALGLGATVFVPESAPAAKLTQLLSFGARVFAVRGNYDDAFDLCLAASEEFSWFNRSTGYNPFTREGKKTCAYEIWAALDGRIPDRIVVATGDGNCLSGMWKGWCDLRAVGLIDRVPKIDCAQSAASAAISDTVHRLRDSRPAIDSAKPDAGTAISDIAHKLRDRTPAIDPAKPEAGKAIGETVNKLRDSAAAADWSKVVVDEVKATTAADSIAVDRPRDGLAAVKAIIDSGGEAVTVPDNEILAAIPEMARTTGLFAEPAAATPWAAVKQMLRDNKIEADELVVCIVSGSGLKDIARARAAAGKPLVIDPSIAAVRAALTRVP